MMMMEEIVVSDSTREGLVTPKKSSVGKFLTAFVFVGAIYAAATTFGSRSASTASIAKNKDVTIQDLWQAASNRRALRRELQMEGETDAPNVTSETDAPGMMEDTFTSNMTEGIDTSNMTEEMDGATAAPVVVTTGGNRTRRYLQETTIPPGNATEFLEIDMNGTRYLQEVGGRGRRFLQVNATTEEALAANGTLGTRRLLRDADLSMILLYPDIMDMELPSPCHRVDVGMPNSPEWRARCQKYLNEEYSLKECDGEAEKVPRIYHSVSHHSDQTYHQLATSAQNPSFIRNHLSDEEAAIFIKNNCGEEAEQAYRCFAPPAYRADLFRFCALYSQGGIYLDEDIFPFVPLTELYSPCSTATVGHDFPWMDKKGKQMKILAAAPGAPIFRCALHNIIENVRARAYPESELELTGPQMLQKCFEENHEDVAVTYHDTRNAEWPFTGMRRGQKILAYEIPMSSKHFWQEGGKDKEDYKDLFNNRQVYKETCDLR